jgi:hypothetical protein
MISRSLLYEENMKKLTIYTREGQLRWCQRWSNATIKSFFTEKKWLDILVTFRIRNLYHNKSVSIAIVQDEVWFTVMEIFESIFGTILHTQYWYSNNRKSSLWSISWNFSHFVNEIRMFPNYCLRNRYVSSSSSAMMIVESILLTCINW